LLRAGVALLERSAPTRPYAAKGYYHGEKDGQLADSEGCVFCRIVAGSAPAHIVYEDDLSLVILDINPLAVGHCLAIPKRHVPWWHELTTDETESLFAAGRIVANGLMEALQPDFVCLYARGRRIPHTHVFLVPTWEDDPVDRHFNSLEGFQEGARRLAELSADTKLTEIAALLRQQSGSSNG
jgi:histidine triad (HIT) family protein